MKLINKLLKKTKPNKNTRCLEYTGTINHCGYGRLHTVDGQKMAHRVMYEYMYGEIPPKMIIGHVCDNPCCVNPFHLFCGTNQDNVTDCVMKGRDFHPIGELHPSHKLKEKDVLELRKLFATGLYDYKALARRYKVDKTNISHIIRRQSWKHI